MGLKLKKKVETHNTQKEVLSKRGKKSRRKGASYERDIAHIFQNFTGYDFVRTPQSGGFCKKSDKAEDFRGDILPADKDVRLKLHIECKSHKTWALPSWWSQSFGDCPVGRIPVVVFHKYGTSANYIALDYQNFKELLKHPNYSLPTTKKSLKPIWKEIYGFNGYFISSNGQVKSCISHNGKEKISKPMILSIGISPGGYGVVVLRKDGKSYTKRVHRLVAENFLGEPNGRIVNHKDGNKLNNCVNNLEYVTYSENLSHAYSSGLRRSGEDIHTAKLSDNQVLDIRVKRGFGVSSSELLKEYSISSATLSRISNNDYRNPYGLYVFCKNQEKWNLKDWLRQAQEDCPVGRIPVVVMKKANTNKSGQKGNQQNLVVLDLDDFLQLVDVSKVVEKRDIQ